VTHAWHDVELRTDAPHVFNAIVEIPAGSTVKYEVDKATGLLRVDRVLYSAVHYPANYGFFPQTYCGDGDPLDVLVLGQAVVTPLVIIRATPIGVLRMIDQDAEDDKVIAVHADDPEYREYRDIAELPEHRRQIVRRFFEDYKALEQKHVQVERYLDRAAAEDVVQRAAELYATHRVELTGPPRAKRPLA
jgi:inorganic pyrophosphatase